MDPIEPAPCEYHQSFNRSVQSPNSREMPRNAIWVGSVLLLVAALYWPDTVGLGRYWLDLDVNERSGILIALLSGFLLFRARERFEQISISPTTAACMPLIACAAASLICWRAGILTLQFFFLPLILWLAVLAVFGWQAARAAGFAVGFLYFGLPGWGVLAPALQRLTEWAVGVIGPAVGLPVAMSGTMVLLPGGMTFVIERGCAGVDFLTVGLAVAALYGELEQASFRRRVRLLGGMLLFAIVSNWVRVILIIEIGYRSHMRSALATRDHLAFGRDIFAAALLLFVWLASRGGRSTPDVPVVAGPGRAASGIPAPRHHDAWRYGLIATTLLVVPVLAYGSLIASEPRAAAPPWDLPQARAPWHGPTHSADLLWQPRYVGAHTEHRGRYQSEDGRVVEIVAIRFPRQSQGVQILNEGNSLLGNHGLAIEGVSLVEDTGIPHAEVVVRDPQHRRSLIWSVIDIGGRLFAEPVSSQLWYGVRSLIGTSYSALFAMRTECDSSCDAARAVLTDFLRANGPALFASPPNTNIKG
ncbi:MAG TPA: EpsI family protein [Steroidobacteraceae bacterium]|nr:EpsI family protein [Steroidobacteraceae bacterium]